MRKGAAIGEYRVVKRINRGGMAHVFEVNHQHSVHALKLAREDLSAQKTEFNNNAIRREAELLRNLDHRRIVKIKPIDEPGGRVTSFYSRATAYPSKPWYFIMEHLAGNNLKRFVDRHGPLSLPEATNIVGNVCLGLRYLHEDAHVVHADLKPENIVFRAPVVKGQPFDPVIIDFGAATGTKSFSDAAGSVFIMAPERIRNATGSRPPERTDAQSPEKWDVWSIGILLYFCLSKKLPFPALKTSKISSQILKSEPTPIEKHNTSVPPIIQYLISEKCLNKNPEARADVQEIIDVLRPYGSGQRAGSTWNS